jgi:hypothetical protein
MLLGILWGSGQRCVSLLARSKLQPETFSCAPGQSQLVRVLGADLLGGLDDESFATADVAEPEGVSSRAVGTPPAAHLSAGGWSFSSGVALIRYVLDGSLAPEVTSPRRADTHIDGSRRPYVLDDRGRHRSERCLL